MKQQKQYTLREAIKNFYTTEPLKTDVATKVADTIFSKQRKFLPGLDNWLYIFAAVLIAGGIVYSFRFFKQVSLLYGLMIIISISVYFILSLKEYSLMSKKLLM